MKGYGISCLTLSVLMVVIQLQDVEAYFNRHMQNYKFECPAGQILQTVKSKIPWRYKDRMTDFTCTDLPVGKLQKGGISWTRFSRRNRDFKKICPGNTVITGISSVFKYARRPYRYNDRIYRFKCSKLENAKLENCRFTDYQNEIGDPLNYKVPQGMAIHGVGTYYWRREADRRFKFEVCKVKKN